jgi:hypothetical protein
MPKNISPMKKMISFFIAIVCCYYLDAQGCNNYYYMQNNKTITMTLFNGKGKENGKYIYKVSDVKSNGGTITSRVESQVMDDKGKTIAGSTANMKCTGGMYMADMKVMMPPQQANQMKDLDANSEFYLEYPASIKVGDVLKDGTFNADMTGSNGMEMSLEMHISDRKVVGEETVTTSAGSWKCYRITHTDKLKTKVAGMGIPITINTTEWFAPGFGIVKTESKWGRSEITSIQ